MAIPYGYRLVFEVVYTRPPIWFLSLNLIWGQYVNHMVSIKTIPHVNHTSAIFKIKYCIHLESTYASHMYTTCLPYECHIECLPTLHMSPMWIPYDETICDPSGNHMRVILMIRSCIFLKSTWAHHMYTTCLSYECLVAWSYWLQTWTTFQSHMCFIWYL